jgi:hypothetical protein
MGNGGSNEPANNPIPFLATSTSDIANRKHFAATAIAAQAQQAVG